MVGLCAGRHVELRTLFGIENGRMCPLRAQASLNRARLLPDGRRLEGSGWRNRSDGCSTDLALTHGSGEHGAVTSHRVGAAAQPLELLVHIDHDLLPPAQQVIGGERVAVLALVQLVRSRDNPHRPIFMSALAEGHPGRYDIRRLQSPICGDPGAMRRNSGCAVP